MTGGVVGGVQVSAAHHWRADLRIGPLASATLSLHTIAELIRPDLCQKTPVYMQKIPSTATHFLSLHCRPLLRAVAE